MKCSGFGSNQGRRQPSTPTPRPPSLEFSDCAVNNSKAPSAECLSQANSSFGNFLATEGLVKLFGSGIKTCSVINNLSHLELCFVLCLFYSKICIARIYPQVPIHYNSKAMLHMSSVPLWFHISSSRSSFFSTLFILLTSFFVKWKPNKKRCAISDM
jgi:hypothetical protein